MVSDNRIDPILCDPLTGAYSRALFQERFPLYVAQAGTMVSPLSLCVFDLDYFKSINDAYGHRRGDQVLSALVARLQPQLRPADLLFRYGGDEFVLLLPDTTKQEATAIARRLLETVLGNPFPGEPVLCLSVSIGVAALPDDGEDCETLFEAADRRNYQAKRQGRGCVVGDTSEVPSDILMAETNRLVEREAAEEALKSFLTRMAEAKRGLLAVSGPAGTGRTRLLRACIEAAGLRGWATMTLTGSPLLKSKPYGVLEGADWPGGQPVVPGAHVEMLQQSLAKRGQQRLFIAVDNLRDLDRATRCLLRKILVDSDFPCLAVAYVEDAPDMASFLKEDMALWERIELLPLSRSGVTIWLRNLLHWEPPNDFIDWLHKETEGRPAWLRTALTALREQGALKPHEAGGWSLSQHYRQITLQIAAEARIACPPHNLPALLTEFVGRDRARQEVAALLDRGRLTTLLGPGGIGKTRLALQVAREHLYDFEEGIWFVPLAPLHSPEQIPGAIAAALGVMEKSDKPLAAALKDYLVSRRVLVILDNCEHLAEACALLIAELLHHCPGLHILTTSRQVLNMPGETTWRIPALTMPEPGHLPSGGAELLSELIRYDSVQLFIKRAEEAQKTFQLSSENALTIAHICVQLEGIPLALELAAARIRALPVEQIARRLEDRFRLLTGGSRTALPHHQTLRALIDWSYDLLSEQERGLLRRLSVFAGGCTLEAAEQVCSGEQSAHWEILDLLTSLVDKSLVMYSETGAQGRYRLLETIRQYGYDRLKESGRHEREHDRHLAFFLAMAEEAAGHMFGAEQVAWLDRLEVECNNLNSALDWCQCRVNAAAEGLRFVSALERFWDLHGHLSEGRARCRAVLSREDAAGNTAERAKALLTLGRLARRQNDVSVARLAVEESVAIGREIGDRQLIAQGCRSLSSLAFTQGNNAEAQTLIQQSLTLFQELADEQGVGYSLCLAGLIANAMGDLARSRKCHEESLTLFRKLENTQGVAMELCNLGEVALIEGDLVTARECQEECVRLDEELGDRVGMAYPLENLAGVALRQGQFERAARLMGAANALRVASGTSHFADERARYEDDLKVVRKLLGESGFSRAWDEGSVMTFEQTIAYALGSG